MKNCVRSFVDEYIRSEFMQGLQSDRTSTFYGRHAERADRCYEAAKNGADGSTHREVIQDWRDGLQD